MSYQDITAEANRITSRCTRTALRAAADRQGVRRRVIGRCLR